MSNPLGISSHVSRPASGSTPVPRGSTISVMNPAVVTRAMPPAASITVAKPNNNGPPSKPPTPAASPQPAPIGSAPAPTPVGLDASCVFSASSSSSSSSHQTQPTTTDSSRRPSPDATASISQTSLPSSRRATITHLSGSNLTIFGAVRRDVATPATVNWGPPLWPKAAPETPAFLATLYNTNPNSARGRNSLPSGSNSAIGLSPSLNAAPSPSLSPSPSPSPPTASPPPAAPFAFSNSLQFAPPPHPPQRIMQDEEFWQRYKAVWSEFNPIHDGIERPAVYSLLPPKVFWMGKKMMDIGCGTGKLCRRFRDAHALSVLGIDASSRMVNTATLRELAEETLRKEGSTAAAAAAAAAAGATTTTGAGGGFTRSLRRFFGAELSESELMDRLEKERSKLQRIRDESRLAAEEQQRNNESQVRALAAATAEIERERARTARELADNKASIREKEKETAGFFKKLFKESEKLKPSSEADAYKAEAETKRMQREHEERIARINAAAAAAAASATTSTGGKSAQPNPSGNGASHSRTNSSRKNSADDSSVFSLMKKTFTLDSDPFARTPSSSLSSEEGDRPLPFIPVNYLFTSFENYEVNSDNREQFHLITCTMTLAYIWDIRAFARKVSALLSSNGLFVMSVEHPTATASWGQHPLAVMDEDDPEEIDHFPLDSYDSQGERVGKYYVEGVIKYHRRTDTYINAFLSAGLVLEKMIEPRASVEMETQHPELKKWRRRPLFLCLRFRKPRHDDF